MHTVTQIKADEHCKVRNADVRHYQKTGMKILTTAGQTRKIPRLPAGHFGHGHFVARAEPRDDRQIDLAGRLVSYDLARAVQCHMLP